MYYIPLWKAIVASEGRCIHRASWYLIDCISNVITFCHEIWAIDIYLTPTLITISAMGLGGVTFDIFKEINKE